MLLSIGFFFFQTTERILRVEDRRASFNFFSYRGKDCFLSPVYFLQGTRDIVCTRRKPVMARTLYRLDL